MKLLKIPFYKHKICLLSITGVWIFVLISIGLTLFTVYHSLITKEQNFIAFIFLIIFMYFLFFKNEIHNSRPIGVVSDYDLFPQFKGIEKSKEYDALYRDRAYQAYEKAATYCPAIRTLDCVVTYNLRYGACVGRVQKPTFYTHSILLSAKLVKDASLDELTAIIIHEYAHVAHKDEYAYKILLTCLMIAIAAEPFFSVLGFLLVNYVNRQTEYAADFYAGITIGKNSIISGLQLCSRQTQQFAGQRDFIWEYMFPRYQRSYPILNERIEVLKRML